MGNQSVISIEAVIDYIESHLDGKLELETVAEAVHYSKYHLAKLEESIDEKRALVLREGDILIGAMAFTYSPGSIEFLGVHPQYRNRGLQKLFLDALLETYLPGQEISTTTFREQDKADTGHRDMLLQLGFAEKELLTEFGYPTQRFVLPPKKQEDIQHG